MNDLKDLLISRIQDIKLILENAENNHKKSTIALNLNEHSNCSHKGKLENIHSYSCHQQSSTLQQSNRRLTQRNDSFQCDQNNSKTKSKLHFIIKKRQKSRIEKQLKILSVLNNSTFSTQKHIQDFYILSLEIFQSYDSCFSKYKNQNSFMSVSMQLNLKKMYTIFFLKHDEELSAGHFVQEITKLEITDLSPSFFLGWIRKWSTTLLQSLLNLNEDDNEFQISIKLNIEKIKQKIHNNNNIFTKKNRYNSFNFFSKKKPFIQTSITKSHQETKQVQNTFECKVNKLLSNLQVSQTQNLVPINCKQIIYSYCLDQMKAYYKNYPLDDLDHAYLRAFKKLGKKDQILLGPNAKNAVQTLIDSKNSSIQSLMNKFGNQYKKFKIHQKALYQKNYHDKKQSPSLYINSSSKKDTSIRNDQNKSLHDRQGSNLQSLNSKLLTPISKTLESKQKYFINKKVGMFSYEDSNKKIATQQTFSNSVSIKGEIINYNKIFTEKKKNQISQSQINIDLLKRLHQKFPTEDGQIWYRHKKGSRKRDQLRKQHEQDSEQSNMNHSKLPKLSLKGIPKHIDKKKIQIRDENEYFNRSELLSNKKKQFAQDISNALYSKNIRLQSFVQKSFGVIIGAQTDSSVIEKNYILRSNSNFSINSKQFFGSKKPSLNMMKISKNRGNLNAETQSLQIINTLKNKTNEKKSSNSKSNDKKISSNHSFVNVFSTNKVGLDQSDKKNQFIEYLKNLHREKIKSEVFQQKLLKSKQKQIKKKSP